MNKKITVQNGHGNLTYCILSGDENLEDQLNRWYYGSPNPEHGLCVQFNNSEIAVVDYYHAETIGSIKVVSIEDTDEEPILQWINL